MRGYISPHAAIITVHHGDETKTVVRKLYQHKVTKRFIVRYQKLWRKATHDNHGWHVRTDDYSYHS